MSPPCCPPTRDSPSRYGLTLQPSALPYVVRYTELTVLICSFGLFRLRGVRRAPCPAAMRKPKRTGTAQTLVAFTAPSFV